MSLSNKKNIRNFAIIAHIDHGKSTLADQLLMVSGLIPPRNMQSQILDSMDIEKERGITIKLNAVQIPYQTNNQKYFFNLIDTPGHIDFTYEVSRSLAACEGALLVIDATQGIEAQTLANINLALQNNLVIVPLINKIDLLVGSPTKIKQQIKKLLPINTNDIPLISAKTGQNIDKVFKAIINQIPDPQNADESKPLSALIFDSYYDKYRGVVAFIRIKHGVVKLGNNILFMGTKAKYEVLEIGIKNPYEKKKTNLVAGEVGWISANIKKISDVVVGDTITFVDNSTKHPYPGYKNLLPVVYCGLYPLDSSRYVELKEVLEKIKLSDSALVFEPETSQALGFGYRCGFLGLLHMEVIQERIEREFNITLIASAPSVKYKVTYENGQTHIIDKPSKINTKLKIKSFMEPYCLMKITTPNEYIGLVMDLCQKKRGNYIKMNNIGDDQTIIEYKMPLGEVIFQFFDILKSVSRGYATMDYQLTTYQESKLVKVDIFLNKERIDAFSFIVHKDFAYRQSRIICQKLKEIIPRQNFEVPIQAVIGSKVLARETIKAMRKNVTAKCYGGDISRKKKLLRNQKKGKKKLKAIGSVEIPQEAFMAILKRD